MEDITCIPVPRRAMANGWSPARQWEFLQRLADTGSVAESARRVGMSEASAYRLRRHPEAADFRRAWDAAMTRVWQRVEQVALERVVNGDIEVIEREGVVIATGRRPCSDRLMIHMLKEQVRRAERQAAALAAANAALLAAARDAPWPVVRGRHVAQPPPEPTDAATAETQDLRACHDRAARLPDSTGWNGEELVASALDGPVPRLPMPEKTLVPADARLVLRMRAARVKRPQPDEAAAAREVRKTPPGADFSREEEVPPPGLDRFRTRHDIAPAIRRMGG